ncbi:MAG: bifunctional UDP-N-acetylglucosamine diphosphorylase/glucosamine-1-phosphate N-acetyltransferase GlmU, partial [Christensenellaceae bacterium]|nr:bifunctional UDP-N-acetylglucosamine diphosphorylase/glucosamine-1-phosphate N-acetyltransferase GlmU [Christensenellaceae bacterium]
VDYSSPFWAITNINRDGVCAFCANIEALLSKINDADLSFNNLDDLYLKLLSSNVNSIEISNDEKLQIEGSINYGQIYKYLSLTINENFMKRGVFIMDTNSTYIGFDVKIGAGTLIYPNNTINGDTSIGKNCTLFSNNHIENAKIGDNNKIKASVMFDCIIGNNNEVGPFAYIRPQSSIADNCKIGDFVEIKNSSIDDHTKISHLTYVGDSDLGKNINLGCGVVFVNYDGKLKHRSTVGDNAFIGCNTNIISPITISNNAFIAAGSTVTEDVPEYAFYIARSKGTIKENWVKDRHEKGKI